MDHNSINRQAEKQLVERILQGDSRAFEAVIKSTERLVGQIVGRMIGNAEDRKDIIQDIYLNTFKHLPGFRHAARLSTWIGHIAYNTCLNFLEKRRLILPGENFLPEEEENAQASNAIESLIAHKQLTAILSEKLALLPPVYRTLIVLFHQEAMSYSEIGEITSLPEGTVKSYLFRARKQLKEHVLTAYKKDEL
ncbi:sigma-70 family RNA polymerase sigma factor [Flavitalea sp. BT771]|uniref:RNA polymerase sigma factor n=1 Tax=Flavitalea sp. BT771 TaxID=3063329 RepID=UPI0026E2E281|nr:sigma-70 family RNA polymerase sigma factor [Flavitalea sp. BT771]MDO6432597.1 sigma-70 family RNA polymerase sigma factor [Flavitalea sp. BT771]MDV6222127.1 sigma-70 family RNA polymerase sigma factor [Flavitalea sp. BT771]